MVNKKAPAFTILEVTVAMLLSAIVISIAYLAFTVVNGYYARYSGLNARVAEFLLADNVLGRDVRDASLVMGTATGIRLQTTAGEIEYVFQPQYILRSQYGLKTDTIRVQATSPELTFERAPAGEGQKADHISFVINLEGRLVPLIYQKRYGASQLFE
ncbi:PulJ/GspJ family protein [Hufsiella ginkgonis]|uniref:Prepilin-type N-terminal cleavage/methylation domain-containing protein n=1 Tax=Hufsiella ginkgonis TaxID=2695274 RepID=A0A7K1XXT6_9SPHI|nr:prepilin-type N-terminal cleavage/methylation domain-containing protein [Hufsiella ginkgonis]MXV15762.1 hypothetical protein [Hufsiella ginkgonis]